MTPLRKVFERKLQRPLYGIFPRSRARARQPAGRRSDARRTPATQTTHAPPAPRHACTHTRSQLRERRETAQLRTSPSIRLSHFPPISDTGISPRRLLSAHTYRPRFFSLTVSTCISARRRRDSASSVFFGVRYGQISAQIHPDNVLARIFLVISRGGSVLVCRD